MTSPQPTPLAVTLTWDARLPLDIALNESSVTGRHLYSDLDLIARYGLSQSDYDTIRKLPAFRDQVREAIQELQTNGLSVKRKASVLFELYLDTVVPTLMADNNGVDPKIKLDTLKFLGQVAGKDGKADSDALAAPLSAMPTLNIVLQTAPQQPQLRVVTSEG